MSDKIENNSRDVRLDNLTPGGPGRPKGQKNYATLYKEALIKIAEKADMQPDDLELEIIQKGLLSARKGDYRFYKDLLDRLHGKPIQPSEVTANITGTGVIILPEKNGEKMGSTTEAEDSPTE
jgi:hypothetical protein